jgi:mannosyltransferase
VPALIAERAPGPASTSGGGRRMPSWWWPVAALLALAAALRLSTLGLQSFWYDEAFTPVHVLHASLGATLRAMVHSENNPPLWYLLAWADSRLLGTGEVALRLPSALAGIATVGVAAAIGWELTGRRAALATAALVACNPLLVWYSQEARSYGLFVLVAGVAMLCFLRAEHEPTPRRMAAFAVSGALALLTHYFAVFLLIPMALWLLAERRTRRVALPALLLVMAVGAALLPLIVAQGGHGTQWIGRWALASRLEAIPQYYLTGYSGSSLGHGVELLAALPILVGLGLLAWRALDRPGPPRRGTAGEGAAGGAAAAVRPAPLSGAEARAVKLTLAVAAGGVLIPVALALVGVDYLAPRNLVAAMVPVSALIAVLLTSEWAGRAGILLLAITAAGFLALSVDGDLSPRLQRGNWRAVARAIGGTGGAKAITTVQLGSAPLEYYVPGLHSLPRQASVTVSEIDETGYAPLRASAGSPPAPGFRLRDRLDIDGLIVYRFTSPTPRSVTERSLRRHVITLAHPEVLVPAGTHATLTASREGP